MNSLTLKDATSFSGYLEKKSPSLFGGWQKRFFKILEGRVLTYSEKEKDKEFKGTISLEDVSQLKATDKKCFSFLFGDRTWDLRADSDDTRDKWVSALNLLIQELKNIKLSTQNDEEDLPDQRGRGQSTSKVWKKGQQDSNTLEILKKSGFTDKDDEMSNKAIKVKIKNLNFELPEIKSRIQFGFIMKKHKKDYLFQKRWFFIISSRPLNDNDYEKDDQMIFKNPVGIQIDTLYYYSFDNDNDDSKAKGEISMSECSELATIDKDNKFFLIVDVGDRKYEFQSDIKGERDRWYNCLRNSRKTAKDIKKSITKKPRNISRLLIVIENEGIGKLRELCEKEKDAIVQNYKDIKEFDLLDGYYIKNIQDILYQTIDACVLYDSPKTDIIKTYVETFNTTYLLVVQRYWSNCYANMDQSQIVKLASLLFTHEETLTNFGVTDPNFSQNGRELIKIFIKKTFVNVKTLIESILKNEREVKANKSGDGILITHGPLDLFKMLYSLIDIFKKENYKIKYVIEQLLNLSKECIIQYLIGVDCVISKSELDIDKEFLIGVANNSIKIHSQLDDFLDEIKSMKVLNDQEVQDASGEKEITSSLGLIANNSISRFVHDLSDALVSEFQDHFLKLELDNILTITFDTYRNFIVLMHVSIQKKCWNESLKAILFQYIKSLLTTAHKNVKRIDDLTNKLRTDKKILLDAYSRVLGEHLTKETLKILDDFLDFLDVSPEMISVSCTKLREFNGPSFTLNTAKALINLRCDLSKDDKNEAISSCKGILEGFGKGGESNLGNNKSSGFFDNLESEIKIQEKLEREENENMENLEDVEEVGLDKRRKTLNLTDFLNIGVDIGDLDDEENCSTKEKEDVLGKNLYSKSKEENTIDTDVVFEGVMKKKSYNTWQERFFQIKNGLLYWYKEKSSKEAQNSIAITTMKKIQGHKACKFLVVCGEKVYKFSCNTDEDKENWIKALNNELKRIKGDTLKKLENIFEVKLKKKIIQDFYELPNINAEKLYMKKKVEEAIKSETFFVEKVKAKPNLKPNKKIMEKKTQNFEEIVRNKDTVDASFDSGTPRKTDISPMEIGLIDRKPKQNSSIFMCCKKLLTSFRKKRNAEDYES